MQQAPAQYPTREEQPQQLNRPPRDGVRGDLLWRQHQSAIARGRGSQGHPSLGLNRRARPVNVQSVEGSNTWSPLKGLTRSMGRGARPPPMLPPSASRHGQDRSTCAGKAPQVENNRSYPQESLASEHSLNSQASGCSVWGARQQQVREPAKPPRPPGPPPPHILEEQRKRKEMAALQRAQQQSACGSGGGI
ncbi:unnamed protein product, partial [Pylaiella littoralis]